MGYVPGLDTDVFISYAHKNNATKWVDGLHAYLKTRVPEFLPHSADVQIWQDEKLNGFDELWTTLRDRVNASALLLSICSPVYVTSESCEKEVVGFLNDSLETPRVDRRSRTARAVIIPYEGEQSIKPCFVDNPTVWYTFFKENRGVFEQFDAGSPEFNAEANRLAQHIAAQLRRMRAEVERAAPQSGTSQRKLFVANCASDRATERKTLLNEFKGFELLTLSGTAQTRAEIEQQTQQFLEQAECSIHLLGELPGTDSGRQRRADRASAVPRRAGAPAGALHADRLGAEHAHARRRAAEETGRDRAGVQRRRVAEGPRSSCAAGWTISCGASRACWTARQPSTASRAPARSISCAMKPT